MWPEWEGKLPWCWCSSPESRIEAHLHILEATDWSGSIRRQYIFALFNLLSDNCFQSYLLCHSQQYPASQLIQTWGFQQSWPRHPALTGQKRWYNQNWLYVNSKKYQFCWQKHAALGDQRNDHQSIILVTSPHLCSLLIKTSFPDSWNDAENLLSLFLQELQNCFQTDVADVKKGRRSSPAHSQMKLREKRQLAIWKGRKDLWASMTMGRKQGETERGG